MSGETRAGWPVRRFSPNGHSCLAGESGGVSWGAWFACCPQGTYPKGSREDRWCDGRNDAPGNSTSHPQCADSKWKLWTLDGRYFCCDDGNEDRGYYYTNSQYYYFGCASDDWIANTNASVRRAGSYPNPPASPPKSSPANKGAIAGGVVGGVCGALIIVGILVWFLCRRRRQSKTDISGGIPATSNNAALQPGARYESIPNELGDNRHEPVELDGALDRKEAPATARQELAGVTPREQQPAELP